MSSNLYDLNPDFDSSFSMSDFNEEFLSLFTSVLPMIYVTKDMGRT